MVGDSLFFSPFPVSLTLKREQGTPHLLYQLLYAPRSAAYSQHENEIEILNEQVQLSNLPFSLSLAN